MQDDVCIGPSDPDGGQSETQLVSYCVQRDIEWTSQVKTRATKRASRYGGGTPIDCRFSFPMSFCDPLTFGDASFLISCHLRFVSNSCHFCSRCIWGPFGMLGLSVCTPSRKDGIASRDSDRSGRCTSAEADRRTAPLRTNVPESGCPRTVSASNSWIIVIIHEIELLTAPRRWPAAG